VEELALKRNPEATNTELFLKLASKLPSFLDLSPSAMRPVKPGVARVVWRQIRCMQKIEDSSPAIDLWPVLTNAVATNQAILGELQRLLDAGGIEFIDDYSQPIPGGWTNLVAVKNLVTCLTARAMLALHEGRMQEAVHYFKASGTVSRITAQDPTVVNQYVRYACIVIMAGGYWEILQANGWTDGQMAQLQHEWDQPDILAAAEASLAMERANGPTLFQLGRTSRQELTLMLATEGSHSPISDNDEIWHDFTIDPRTGINDFLTSYPRYYGWRWIWSYRDERHYLEFMQTMIDITRDAKNGRPIPSFLKERTDSESRYQSMVRDFDVSGLISDDIERFVGGALRAQTVVNMVSAAIALERFRLSHHTHPAALANLVPEFLQTVPVDCMDGHDLRYRLNPDGTYLLYSVGDDGIDNGGDATPKEGSSSSFWYNGRDLVWPRPATAEEVQAYEAEQNKPKAGSKRQH
jgi:hypothetical protein